MEQNMYLVTARYALEEGRLEQELEATRRRADELALNCEDTVSDLAQDEAR